MTQAGKQLARARLDCLCRLVTDGTHDSPKLQQSGIPFVKGKHISGGYVDLENCDHITKEDHEKVIQRSKPERGDILFSNIGSVGDAAFISIDKEFSIKNVALFKPAPDVVDSKYLYYVVIGPKFRGELFAKRSGVAQPFFSLEMLRSHEVEYHHDLTIQKKIASILSAYDDLIENNLRRIKISEEMAQSLYREWFVKFRFPGHEQVRMVDFQLGKIPEGWGVTTLDSVLSVLESGSRPKGGIDPSMRDVPSIGAENILGLGKYDFSKEKFVSREFFEKMKRGHINNGDVLLYKDGAKIGRKSMFLDNFPHSECCINEHVFILRTNEKCGQAYLFFWLDQPDITAGIINLNANAAQPGINQKGVKGLPILLPDRIFLDLFDEFVEPLLAKLFNLAKKNQVLRRTRDLLLPKLISGELDVSELEIETGGIVNG